ncbi:MAG: hypothetical protein WBR26_26940, partial [Candidatus Acidiferrum sp.]
MPLQNRQNVSIKRRRLLTLPRVTGCNKDLDAKQYRNGEQQYPPGIPQSFQEYWNQDFQYAVRFNSNAST